MALGCVAAMAAHASTQYNVRGTEYQADTLFHAMLGPGTSQTSLLMRSAEGRQMYVYYAKIDLTNPYISFSTVMGQDSFAGTETVRSMSERKSRPGALFLGREWRLLLHLRHHPSWRFEGGYSHWSMRGGR